MLKLWRFIHNVWFPVTFVLFSLKICWFSMNFNSVFPQCTKTIMLLLHTDKVPEPYRKEFCHDYWSHKPKMDSAEGCISLRTLPIDGASPYRLSFHRKARSSLCHLATRRSFSEKQIRNMKKFPYLKYERLHSQMCLEFYIPYSCYYKTLLYRSCTKKAFCDVFETIFDNCPLRK